MHDKENKEKYKKKYIKYINQKIKKTRLKHLLSILKWEKLRYRLPFEWHKKHGWNCGMALDYNVDKLCKENYAEPLSQCRISPLISSLCTWNNNENQNYRITEKIHQIFDNHLINFRG